jgi:hypothetical protein
MMQELLRTALAAGAPNIANVIGNVKSLGIDVLVVATIFSAGFLIFGKGARTKALSTILLVICVIAFGLDWQGIVGFFTSILHSVGIT